MQGVNVSILKSGTKLIVYTKNSIYQFETTNKPNFLYAIGGKHIKVRKKVYLNGSTFGGSIIKQGWVVNDMQMEIRLGNRRVLTTTPVENIKIIGENYQYDLESLH